MLRLVQINLGAAVVVVEVFDGGLSTVNGRALVEVAEDDDTDAEDHRHDRQVDRRFRSQQTPPSNHRADVVSVSTVPQKRL